MLKSVFGKLSVSCTFKKHNTKPLKRLNIEYFENQDQSQNIQGCNWVLIDAYYWNFV